MSDGIGCCTFLFLRFTGDFYAIHKINEIESNHIKYWHYFQSKILSQ